MIYIASKTKHAARWRELRALGCPINSTWIDEAGVGETSRFRWLANRRIDEAMMAKVLILYAEEGETLKGALFEAGAALAAGVPVVSVGPSPSKTFVNHPLWHQADSLTLALAKAEELCPSLRLTDVAKAMELLALQTDPH